MASDITFANVQTNSIYKILKRSLIRKIFVGEYLDRRYVEKLGIYRDVIMVDSKEAQFTKYLRAVNTFLTGINKENKWIGITEEKNESLTTTQDNMLIWVDFQELPLGKYWFQVQEIQLKESEVLIKLKNLRPYHDNEHSIHEVMDISMDKIKQVLTFTNMCESLRFTAVVIMTITTFSVNAFVFLSDYIIRFIYALSTLMEAMTPMLYGVLEFLARCIMGLFWLVIMLLKRNPPSINPQAITYNSPRNYKRNRNSPYYY